MEEVLEVQSCLEKEKEYERIKDAKILYDKDGFFSGRLKKIKERELGSRRIWLEDRTWYWDIKPIWRRNLPCEF